MKENDWVSGFPAAVTVCDRNGIILQMNTRSRDVFAADGGAGLIGSNLLDCHPEPARSILADMLKEGRRNVYTIEKNGMKKMILQSPWYEDGRYAGLVELSFEIPSDMPHFIRS